MGHVSFLQCRSRPFLTNVTVSLCALFDTEPTPACCPDRDNPLDAADHRRLLRRASPMFGASPCTPDRMWFRSGRPTRSGLAADILSLLANKKATR